MYESDYGKPASKLESFIVGFVIGLVLFLFLGKVAGL